MLKQDIVKRYRKEILELLFNNLDKQKIYNRPGQKIYKSTEIMQDLNIPTEYLNLCIIELKSERLIEFGTNGISGDGRIDYDKFPYEILISDEGVSFYNSGGFEKEKKKDDLKQLEEKIRMLDFTLKEQQLKLNDLEIKIKPKTYRIAKWAIIISLITFLSGLNIPRIFELLQRLFR